MLCRLNHYCAITITLIHITKFISIEGKRVMHTEHVGKTQRGITHVHEKVSTIESSFEQSFRKKRMASSARFVMRKPFDDGSIEDIATLKSKAPNKSYKFGKLNNFLNVALAKVNRVGKSSDASTTEETSIHIDLVANLTTTTQTWNASSSEFLSTTTENTSEESIENLSQINVSEEYSEESYYSDETTPGITTEHEEVPHHIGALLSLKSSGNFQSRYRSIPILGKKFVKKHAKKPTRHEHSIVSISPNIISTSSDAIEVSTRKHLTTTSQAKIESPLTSTEKSEWFRKISLEISETSTTEAAITSSSHSITTDSELSSSEKSTDNQVYEDMSSTTLLDSSSTSSEGPSTEYLHEVFDPDEESSPHEDYTDLLTTTVEDIPFYHSSTEQSALTTLANEVVDTSMGSDLTNNEDEDDPLTEDTTDRSQEISTQSAETISTEGLDTTTHNNLYTASTESPNPRILELVTSPAPYVTHASTTDDLHVGTSASLEISTPEAVVAFIPVSTQIPPQEIFVTATPDALRVFEISVGTNRSVLNVTSEVTPITRNHSTTTRPIPSSQRSIFQSLYKRINSVAKRVLNKTKHVLSSAYGRKANISRKPTPKKTNFTLPKRFKTKPVNAMKTQETKQIIIPLYDIYLPHPYTRILNRTPKERSTQPTRTRQMKKNAQRHVSTRRWYSGYVKLSMNDLNREATSLQSPQTSLLNGRRQNTFSKVKVDNKHKPAALRSKSFEVAASKNVSNLSLCFLTEPSERWVVCEKLGPVGTAKNNIANVLHADGMIYETGTIKSANHF